MKLPLRILLLSILLLPTLGLAADAEDLARKFKQLPTVPEEELPKLTNKPTPFRGILNHEGLQGHTWVAFPFVENAASLDMDPHGRIYVSEANRFWLGVPDLRGANEMVRDDFKALTVDDRLKMYERYSSHFPEGWFSAVPDRVVWLEDRDNNGAADRRSLFSDHFHQPADGIGFSLLAEEDAVYFTCIPNLWRMTDFDEDGMADDHEPIAGGFGVRVSFIGHDLHGIIRGPDGRLYFSVGDRGYNVTTHEGEVLEGSGRGAVFRCNSDGSDFEVYAKGLRNPQELAFDDHGNLFTFDNTGDIGDKARMVYVIENSDSGWDMSHQSPHHYAKILDWGEFRPPKAVWVSERMFDLWNEEQPQWVYPPAAHVANGPSGVAWLTGKALPEDLRDKFLLTNYRGAAERCTVLLITPEPKGAGYGMKEVKELISGVGASDVELGYDGKLYLADFGGGWSVNENASIQVVEPSDKALLEQGAKTASIISRGFAAYSPPQMVDLLADPDQRIRQAAQFELVARNDTATLGQVAGDESAALVARLHAMWGLGQLLRQNGPDPLSGMLIARLADSNPEIRGNAARVLGDCDVTGAKDAVLALLQDDSLRVRSLAAIALGRISEVGDAAVIEALFTANADSVDVVLRHSILSALDRVGSLETVVPRVDSKSKEERMLAVLFLRRHESDALGEFLDEKDPVIRREVIRAIYDTTILDTAVGNRLAEMDPKGLSEPLQMRIVAANYRRGEAEHAKRMLSFAGDESLSKTVRLYAMHGLDMWGANVETDPVLGHYRPQLIASRSMDQLGQMLGPDFSNFLESTKDAEIKAEAIDLARAAGIQLSEKILREQVADAGLDDSVRVATLQSLAALDNKDDNALIETLLSDKSDAVRATAMGIALARDLPGIQEKASKAVQSESLVTARAAIAGLETKMLESLWGNREKALRPELWLDAFMTLQTAKSAITQEWAMAAPTNPHSLTIAGGDPGLGEQVFRNQGACMQCHVVHGEGGVQGPDLTAVHSRLSREKLLESLINPNAEIAEGYGMSSVSTKDGNMVIGRVAQSKNQVVVTGLDGSVTTLKKKNVTAITPPMSAMPPLALTLPLNDLRDLVAYLASGNKRKPSAGDSESHGKSDEDIAK